MEIIVVGQTVQIDHPTGHGCWWSLDTQYLHSLLHDPFVLALVGRTPSVALAEDVNRASAGLYLFARRTLAADHDWVQQILRAGGAVLANRPEPGAIDQPKARGVIESLRERWSIGSHRSYFFADLDQFDVYDPAEADRVLAWIGEHPDAIVRGNTAIFAGNPWSTIFRYLNTPELPNLLLDLADLLCRIIAGLSGQSDSALATMSEHASLRRDFHAFGYATFVIEQLEKAQGDAKVKLDDARSTAVRAAHALMDAGDASGAQDLLRTAFQMLERENRKLQPEPAIFTDTLHGGGLFSDIGYCEFDWPQHAADVLHNHLDWAEHRNYRFNIDFAAQSLNQLCARFPRLADRLRKAQERGWIDLVNGTWNQPYPPFFTLQSMLRHFDLGIENMREWFGAAPTAYASQEFGFAPQIAEVLAQYGYQGVVMRVQNMGDAPTHAKPLVRWTSPGDRHSLLTLPSHPYKSEQRNEVTYNNLHLKLLAAAQAGNPSPTVFTGLGDLTYYRPFREELARIGHYANVFGRFTTWRDFFGQHSSSANLPMLKPTMEDFDCRAAFLEIKLWQHLRSTMGGSIEHCMRSLEASELFRAMEMIDAVTGPAAAADGAATATATATACWRSLASYQGHDCYFSPNFPSGTFMGGSTGPTSYNGRAIQTVSDYRGVWDAQTIGQRAGGDLLACMNKAKTRIQHSISATDGSHASEQKAWGLFNPGPKMQRVVRFEKAAGVALASDHQALPAQDDGEDRLALVEAPAYSFISLRADERALSPAVSHPVRTGENWLDNDLIRVEFDPRTGIIRRLLSRSGGEETTLLVGGNRFTLPGNGDGGDGGGGAQRCDSLRWNQRGPLLACAEFDISIPTPDGLPRCTIRSWISLEAGQPYVELRQTVESCRPISGDQWEKHLAMQLELPDGDFELQRSHHNVLEVARARQIFSPNLLLAQKGNQRIALLNRGNQFYVRDGSTISAMLICENEPARNFAHAIGTPQGNPLAEARAWVTPWFVVPQARADKAHTQAIDIRPADVELLSLSRAAPERLTVRLANLAGNATRCEVRLPDRIASAWKCDLNGRRVERLPVRDDCEVALDLSPWGIAQLEIESNGKAR